MSDHSEIKLAAFNLGKGQGAKNLAIVQSIAQKIIDKGIHDISYLIN